MNAYFMDEQELQKRLKELEEKWMNNTITPEEAHEYANWYNNQQTDPVSVPKEFAASDAELENRMLQGIKKKTGISFPSVKAGRLAPLKWVAAASILILVGIGTFFWFRNSREQLLTSTSKQLPMDIAPGKEGAILTLADGSQVVLDSLGNRVIASQNGAEVVLKNGQLAYDPTGQAIGEIVYNTMSTPKGRQFQITLPDGTHVWLNSASSIRFPTVFAGKERHVEVRGEVYFEVAKNVKMPFRVNVNNKAEVEVLGTHFNVNAYDNEKSLNTTLLEGSVRIVVAASSDWQQPVVGQKTPPRNEIVLKPGQQAQMLVGGNTQPGIKLSVADIEKVMAWKNGAFNFEGLSLDEAMRQLERWYDIEVVYDGVVPSVNLGGEIGRDVSLADLLTMLAGTKLKFRIEEGRKLVILK